MLSQKTMDAIAAIMGIKADELATAISSENESDLAIPEGRFLVTADEATLLDNHGKKKYDEGKSKGSKDTIELLKTTTGIEFDGAKPDDFVSSFKKAVLEEAKIEPNKTIAERDASILALQKTIEDKNKEFQTLQGTVEQEKRKAKLLGLIPEIPESIGISKEEAMNLYNLSYEKREDGVYKNGVKLKDELQNDITEEAALKAFITEKGWGENPSGRGGGAGGGGGAGVGLGKISTLEEFEALRESKGFAIGSEEANDLLAEAAKENPSLLDG